MQSFPTRDMDLANASDGAPNSNYQADNETHTAHAAHFAQPTYSYPNNSGAFSIDPTMDMNDSYTNNVSANVNGRIDSVTQGSVSSDPTTSSLGTHVGQLNSPSALHAHTPNIAPFSPDPDTRGGTDDTPGPGLIGGDPKRKRSKVSRACDQCRKKKIRCDAEAENGTLKTCSNCQRANNVCEYSRVPQKRGPSKGYIKELSERVQQVEGQLALQNNGGYRSSVDGLNSTLTSDQAFSSPDDDLLLRRQHSLSAQRSPFANMSRDRVPSMGGWSSDGSSVPRLRDRGSVAVAPDQRVPPSSVPVNKPFWAEAAESSNKRRKVEDERVLPPPAAPTFDQNLLADVCNGFRSSLPFLSDAGNTMAILKQSDPFVQHAFDAAVKMLRHSGPVKSGQHLDGTGRGDDSVVFRSGQQLADYLWGQARDVPSRRSEEDNLVLMWVYTLSVVETETDLYRLRGGAISKMDSIRMATELGSFVINSAAFGEKHRYFEHWSRAWHCCSILVSLNDLALGRKEPFHNMARAGIAGAIDILPSSAACLAMGCDLLNTVREIVGISDQMPRSLVLSNKSMVRSFARNVVAFSKRTANDAATATIQQFDEFMELVLSRIPDSLLLPNTFEPATRLVASLCRSVAASGSAQTGEQWFCNPVTMHAFALATLTLLEVLQLDADLYPDSSPDSKVLAPLKDIQQALEQLSDRGSAGTDDVGDGRKSDQDRGADLGFRRERDLTSTPRLKLGQSLHWTDALLAMIEDRTGDNIQKTDGVDLGPLMDKGYLGALAAYHNV